MVEVQDAAVQTGCSSEQVLMAAAELTKSAAELQAEVRKFLERVRAA
jgi:methyl-accepting chemotaxis protein